MANIERLTHLKKLLEHVRATDPTRFDWASWFDTREPEQPDDKPVFDFTNILNPSVEKQEHFCSTTACVLGWAALDPEFNKQGLRVVKMFKPGSNKQELNDPAAWKIILDDGERFEADDESTVGELFFDLSVDEGDFLFINPCNDGDVGIDEAIACVQWLIEGRPVRDEYGSLYRAKHVRRLLEYEE